MRVQGQKASEIAKNRFAGARAPAKRRLSGGVRPGETRVSGAKKEYKESVRENLLVGGLLQYTRGLRGA